MHLVNTLSCVNNGTREVTSFQQCCNPVIPISRSTAAELIKSLEAVVWPGRLNDDPGLADSKQRLHGLSIFES